MATISDARKRTESSSPGAPIVPHRSIEIANPANSMKPPAPHTVLVSPRNIPEMVWQTIKTTNATQRHRLSRLPRSVTAPEPVMPG